MWHQFDEDVARIIESTAKGDADKWLQTMTTIIVTFVAEKIGVDEGKTTRPDYTMKPGAEKIHHLRQGLRTLVK